MRLSWRAVAEQKRLAQAYQATFAGTEAKLVLADLAIFCRETSTAVDAGGPVDMATVVREEGKRAVFLRIKNFLNLEAGELVEDLRQLRSEILAEHGSAVVEARTFR